jgi:hypothetical protein
MCFGLIEADGFFKGVGTETVSVYSLGVLCLTIYRGGRLSDIGSLERQLLKQQKYRHKPAICLVKNGTRRSYAITT